MFEKYKERQAQAKKENELRLQEANKEQEQMNALEKLANEITAKLILFPGSQSEFQHLKRNEYNTLLVDTNYNDKSIIIFRDDFGHTEYYRRNNLNHLERAEEFMQKNDINALIRYNMFDMSYSDYYCKYYIKGAIGIPAQVIKLG